MVAPFAGAWIEILIVNGRTQVPWSLPSRERGLKYKKMKNTLDFCTVAPFAGAWIEIDNTQWIYKSGIVAPFAGAWIEILKWTKTEEQPWSLPSRERGLK